MLKDISSASSSFLYNPRSFPLCIYLPPSTYVDHFFCSFFVEASFPGQPPTTIASHHSQLTMSPHHALRAFSTRGSLRMPRCELPVALGDLGGLEPFESLERVCPPLLFECAPLES